MLFQSRLLTSQGSTSLKQTQTKCLKLAANMQNLRSQIFSAQNFVISMISSFWLAPAKKKVVLFQITVQILGNHDIKKKRKKNALDTFRMDSHKTY